MSLTAALLGVSSTADALYQCEHLYTVPHQKPGGAGVTQKTRGKRGTLDGASSQWGCYGCQGVGSPHFSGLPHLAFEGSPPNWHILTN
jgi:hypothetical protein